MTTPDKSGRWVPVGVGFAIASALLFGLSTPCAKFLLGETPPLLLAGLLYGWLHLTERHQHPHHHERLEHSHRHFHDEHHQHQHEPGMDAGEPHTHWHVHVPLVHKHPHYPDIHHRHSH